MSDSDLRIDHRLDGDAWSIVMDPSTLNAITEVAAPTTLPAAVTTLSSSATSPNVLAWENMAGNHEAAVDPLLSGAEPVRVYILGR